MVTNSCSVTDQGYAVIAETPAVQGRAVAELLYCTDAVDPAEHAAEDQQVVQIVELGRVPPLTRVKGKPEFVMMKQAFAGRVCQGRHHRQLMLDQIETEVVLLDNLGVAPASRTVKFGDQRLSFVDADLVDAVLIAV